MRTRIVASVVAGALLGAGLVGLAAAAGSPATPEAPSAAATAAARTEPTVGATARPSPPPTPSPPPEPAPEPELEPYPELRARIAGLIAAVGLPPGATLGVAVVDDRGRDVIAHQADVPLLPASTQKLVVAAGALRALGAEHRFVTAVEATAPVGADGTVRGDLVLVGGGDPVLVTPIYETDVAPDRPHTPLAALADQIVAAGVRRVDGRILGDASAFADEPLPAGWPLEYLTGLDGVRTSALTVDAGRRLGIRNGRLVGDPEPDPAAQAALQLAWLLGERGVTVGAGWASTRAPPPAAAQLGRVESPPLRDLLTYLIRTSENQVADQIFRSVGAVGGEPTWAGSATMTRSMLLDLGGDWAGVRMADGSGLSRDNRSSARFLAELDLGMTQDAGGEWETLQAVAGQSGTLRRRLQGTVAEGRLRGKTGSLRDVRGLAGAILGPDGRRYHLAVLGNGLDGAGDLAVRALQDEIALALTEDLYGCVRLPPPPATDPASPPPPYELRCAA